MHSGFILTIYVLCFLNIFCHRDNIEDPLDDHGMIAQQLEQVFSCFYDDNTAIGTCVLLFL